MIVKRVGVLSLAKIMTVVYAGIGVIAGIFMALISTMAGSGLSSHGAVGGMGMGMGFGLGAIILFPILYGVLGFVGGIISAWLYNLAAGFIGGIELDLQ